MCISGSSSTYELDFQTRWSLLGLFCINDYDQIVNMSDSFLVLKALERFTPGGKSQPFIKNIIRYPHLFRLNKAHIGLQNNAKVDELAKQRYAPI